MGQEVTGSYDVFLGLTESGLQRLVRALYLEHVAFAGLPYEYSHDYELTAGRRQLFLRVGLPSVRLTPTRTVYNSDGSTRYEEVSNAVGIELPFSDSASLSYDLPETSIYCLNGTITLVLPLIENGGLSLDTTGLLVWLALSDEDPDAGGRTSRNKLGDARVALEAALSGSVAAAVEEALASQAGNSALLSILSLDRTPEAPDPDDLPDTPTLETPSEFLGVDPEVRVPEAETDPATIAMLHLKAKLSSRALAAGTQDDPNLADVSWVSGAHDVEILLSNRLLLEELLPSQLVPRLLEVPARRLREGIREEVIGDEAFSAALRAEIDSEVRADDTFEAAHREQIRQQVEQDESFAQAVMIEILQQVLEDATVPDYEKFAEASRRFEEVIEARRAEEVARRFNATIEAAIQTEVEVRFEARLDQAQRAETNRRFNDRWPSEVETFFQYPMQQRQPVPLVVTLPTIMELQAQLLGQVVVTPPEDFTFPAAEEPNATLLRLELDLFPGGPGINLIRFDLALVGEAVGYTFGIEGQILLGFDHQRGRLVPLLSTPTPQVSVTLAPWVYQQATETISINPVIRVFTIGTIAAWLADIAADFFAPGAVAGQLGGALGPQSPNLGGVLETLFFEATLLDDLLLRAAFRVEHAASGETPSRALIVESKSIAAVGERVGQLGSDSLTIVFQEDGLAGVTVSAGVIEPQNGHRLTGLGSLPRYRADNLSQADLRDPGLTYSAASQAFEPPPVDIQTAGTPDQTVAAFGLQAPDGAPTLLLLWRDELGRWRAFFRTYRQAVPGVHLRLPLPIDLRLRSGWMRCDPAQAEELIRESIEVPIFLGSGQSGLGTIDVGARRRECALDLTAVAVPFGLVPPVESVKWTAVIDGQEHALPLGVAQTLDVPSGTGGLTPVTFTSTGETPIQCHMAAPTGDSGAFTLRVEVVSGLVCFPDDPLDPLLRAARTYRDEEHITFDGRQDTFFGYDRWLALFERMSALLAQDLEGVAPPGPGGGDIDPLDDGFITRARYLLLEEDLEVKDLLNLQPGAERATEPGSLAAHLQLGGRQAVMKGAGRPLLEPGRQDAARLSGVLATREAKSFLTQRVTSRLDDLTRQFPKDRKLGAFANYAQGLLKKLPEPGALLKTATRRSRNRPSGKRKGPPPKSQR